MTTKRTPVRHDKRARITPQAVAIYRRIADLERESLELDPFVSDGWSKKASRMVVSVWHVTRASGFHRPAFPTKCRHICTEGPQAELVMLRWLG